MDVTAGDDILGLCDKECSYTYMCPILDVYGVMAALNWE